MAQEKLSTITTTEAELNLLFRELLEGCRDDLEESKDNVTMYFDEINTNKKDGGIERFAQFYNDSLKIKGLARDRQLKLLNMFKDRVSTKEKISLIKKEETVGGLPDISEMTRMIEEIEKAKKQKPILITPTPLTIMEQEALDVQNSFDEDDDFNEDFEIDNDE